MPKGIVRRTFLFAALLISAVTVMSFAILYFAMPRYYEYKKERDLAHGIDSLVQQLQTAADEAESAEVIREFSARNNVNVMSFSSDDSLMPAISTPFLTIQESGDVQFSAQRTRAMAAADGKGEVREAETAAWAGTTERSSDAYIITVQETEGAQAGADEMFFSVQMILDNGTGLYAEREVGAPSVHRIAVTGTLQPIDEARGVLLSLGPVVLAAGLLIGLVLAWLYARRITGPILRISQAAVRMGDMDPLAHSGVRTGDELGELSSNLDTMYDSLRETIGELKAEMEHVQRLERDKTEMMQSASHELKTPVAALGGMLEGMIDGVGVYRDRDRYLEECKAQVDKLSRLVGEILSASRADAAGDAEPEEVDPGLLLRQALEEHGHTVREKGLRVQVEAEPLCVETDAAALYRAVSNLVSNAVRYTPPGGQVRAAVAAQARTLTLENTCAPIPPDELPRLFEAFYTRSYSRDRRISGTGLGLYIVRRTLERLGFRCAAQSTDTGLIMTLYFD